MTDAANQVKNHYARGEIVDSILRALRESGKDIARLTPADLAPIDAFHIRGRAATVELAKLASLEPGLRVLDVGCGLGGSARYLAAEYRCRVTGIDLTGEYVEAASALAELVGLKDSVEFRQASALELPFDDGSFDLVWTEHVQMNIADKRAFYSEIARVLAPRGRLVFHDIFQGEGGALHFLVPWAEDAAISFLATPGEARALLEALGFRVLHWQDKSAESLAWFEAAMEKSRQSGPSPLGLQLLMGRTTKAKMENNVRNLREARFVVFKGIAGKA